MHVRKALEALIEVHRVLHGSHERVDAVAEVIDHCRRDAARIHLEVDAVLVRARLRDVEDRLAHELLVGDLHVA